MTKCSLDELELASYHAGPAPTETVGKLVTLTPGGAACVPEPFSLNGTWDYLEQEETPAEGDWAGGFPGEVPSEVHMALWKAGRIPDPVVGENQVTAREHSFKTWWLRRRFSFAPQAGHTYRLSFEGVADRCTVWLNGQELCRHQGMFGGPDADITELLRTENELLVKLEPIPFRPWGTMIPDNNFSWADTVVINNVYGWHYFNMPQIGIYRPVRILDVPLAEVERPFVFTRDLEKGAVALQVDVRARAETDAAVEITVAPHNFAGETHVFSETAHLTAGTQTLCYEFEIPDARIWWPNDLGAPNLYDVTAAITTSSGYAAAQCLFGLRTIRMEPLPSGPDENTYNWSFVVNGRKVFIKGANWCTIDAMLDLSRARYDRFLSLAKMQHIQFFRAWGAGMPETDDFYDLCSEYGIMILQEWPTAWNSHKTQPLDVLEDTVRRAMKRVRSYPALVMYGAGNESTDPFGPGIDMMGRLSVELDGTRPYHRSEPWGGSEHDYYGYWEDWHVDHHLTAESVFWGEYGYASIPSYETFLRYMPKESLSIWPLEENADFVRHTPCFGYRRDVSHVMQSARYFAANGAKWREFILASQMIHALGVRRVIDRSRVRDPECAGVVYYKMNDNNPAVSWSCVDYYGVPKLAHYVFQDSFEPLRACVLFERTNYRGIAMRLPVHILDDAGRLPKTGWEVRVRAYDGMLALIAEQRFAERKSPETSKLLGRFILDAEQTDTTPLLIVCDLLVNGERISRSFYCSNFEQERGCMFRLPRAGVKLSAKNESVAVENVGKVPAVGLLLTVPGKNDIAVYADNFLWLEPGEKTTVAVAGVDAAEVELDGLNVL